MIKYFSDVEGYDLFKRYCPHGNFIPQDLYNDWLEDIYCYGVSEYDNPVSLDEAKDLYVSLITLGIRVEGRQWIPANDFKNMLEIIQPMSYILSQFAPEYFFPYLFLCRIFELNQIADFFDIDLPGIPKKLIMREDVCIIGDYVKPFMSLGRKMDYLQRNYVPFYMILLSIF